MSNVTTNTALERISSLFDEGSFVELGAGIKGRKALINKEETPSDGVVTGYGLIDGRLVYVYSQNPAVCGGSIGEMHSKKITNIYDMALKMGAPVIGMLDCSGLRLQEAGDALNGLGSIYTKQAVASGIIPQITMIMGSCGGGVSIIPALSDFTFIEEKNGSLFLQSPNAIPANSKDRCDTSSASWKASHTQNVDFIGSEDEMVQTVRKFVEILPANNRYMVEQDICGDDLNRLLENVSDSAADSVTVLKLIADGYEFVETKKHIAPELTTGFLKLNGMTIGCIANRQADTEADVTFAPVLSAEGVKKAAAFVKFCNAFGVPVLTLANIKGFESSFEAETSFPSACASYVSAYASATVPKVTVVLEQAMGSAGVIMGSKSLGTDIVYAWEDAKIGPMAGAQAAKILYEGEDAAAIRMKAAEYEEYANSASAAAAIGSVDAIIDAESTRKYLISAFDMLADKQVPAGYRKHTSI